MLGAQRHRYYVQGMPKQVRAIVEVTRLHVDTRVPTSCMTTSSFSGPVALPALLDLPVARSRKRHGQVYYSFAACVLQHAAVR